MCKLLDHSIFANLLFRGVGMFLGLVKSRPIATYTYTYWYINFYMGIIWSMWSTKLHNQRADLLCKSNMCV